jgi:hypothetical protein
VSVYIPAALRTDHLTCGHDFFFCKICLPLAIATSCHNRHSSFHNDDNAATSLNSDNDNDTTSQDKRQRQQRLVGMEGPGGEGGYGQVVGPNDARSRCLGQVCLIFLSSFVFTNIYLLFTRQQARPTLASKASRWAALRLMNPTLATSASRWGFLLLFNIRTHPRCKRESVGRFYATLATIASRWGLRLYYTCGRGPNA